MRQYPKTRKAHGEVFEKSRGVVRNGRRTGMYDEYRGAELKLSASIDMNTVTAAAMINLGKVRNYYIARASMA